MKNFVMRLLVILVASALMATNLNFFVKPAELFPGGFTGLALLLQDVFSRYCGLELPFSLLLIILNAVPAIASFFLIGKKYTILSCVMIVVSGLMTDLLPNYQVTDDVLLASVFGGLISAVSISLCLYAGATSGGTDFIAIFISDRSGTDAWNYILVFNVVILVVAGLLFGWDKALYSIVFQYAATQAMKVLYKKYQKLTLFIVTDHPEIVYEEIRRLTHHDATLFKGNGCYQGMERNMLYSVISAAEGTRVLRAVRKADPKAFINVVKTGLIRGQFYTQPRD